MSKKPIYTGRNCNEKMYRLYATERSVVIKDLNAKDKKEVFSPGVLIKKGDKNGVLVSYSDLMNSDQLRKELTGRGPGFKQNLRLARLDDNELTAVEQKNKVKRTAAITDIVDTAKLESQMINATFFKNKEEMLCTLIGKKPLNQYGNNGKLLFDINGDKLDANIPCFFDRQLIIVEDGKSMGYENPYNIDMITPVLGFFIANTETITIDGKEIEVSKEDNSGTVVFCHCFGHGHTEDLVFKGRNYRYTSGSISFGATPKVVPFGTTSIEVPVILDGVSNVNVDITKVTVTINDVVETVPVTFDSVTNKILVDISGIPADYGTKININIPEGTASGSNDEGTTITSGSKDVNINIEDKVKVKVPTPILGDHTFIDDLTIEIPVSNVEGPEFTTAFDASKVNATNYVIDTVNYSNVDKKLTIKLLSYTSGAKNTLEILDGMFINTADAGGQYYGTAQNVKKTITKNIPAKPVVPTPVIGTETVAPDFSTVAFDVTDVEGSGYTTAFDASKITATNCTVSNINYDPSTKKVTMDLAGTAPGVTSKIIVTLGAFTNTADVPGIYDGQAKSTAKTFTIARAALPDAPVPGITNLAVNSTFDTITADLTNISTNMGTNHYLTTKNVASKITGTNCSIGIVNVDLTTGKLTIPVTVTNRGTASTVNIAAGILSNVGDGTNYSTTVKDSVAVNTSFTQPAPPAVPTPLIGTEIVAADYSTVSFDVTDVEDTGYTTAFDKTKITATNCTVSNIKYTPSTKKVTMDLAGTAPGVTSNIIVALGAFTNTADATNTYSGQAKSVAKTFTIARAALPDAPVPGITNLTANATFDTITADLTNVSTSMSANHYLTTDNVNSKVTGTKCSIENVNADLTTGKLTIQVTVTNRGAASTVSIAAAALSNTGDGTNYKTTAKDSVAVSTSFTKPALPDADKPALTGAFDATNKKVTLTASNVGGANYVTTTNVNKISLATGETISVTYASGVFEFSTASLAAGSYTVNIAKGAITNTGDGTNLSNKAIDNDASTFVFTIAAPTGKNIFGPTARLRSATYGPKYSAGKSTKPGDLFAKMTDNDWRTEIANQGTTNNPITTYNTTTVGVGPGWPIVVTPKSDNRKVIVKDAGGVDVTNTVGVVYKNNITIDGIQYDVVVMCYLTGTVLTVEIS